MRRKNLRQDMYMQATNSKTRCDTTHLDTHYCLFEAIQARTHSPRRRRRKQNKEFCTNMKKKDKDKAQQPTYIHTYTTNNISLFLETKPASSTTFLSMNPLLFTSK